MTRADDVERIDGGARWQEVVDRAEQQKQLELPQVLIFWPLNSARRLDTESE
jgi:hypothetical protein